jgi:uncharacterized sodium:solute symporter family permease YidK
MHTIITGIVIILIGVWIWLSHLGYASFNFARDWPIILIIIGLYVIANGISSRVRHRSRRSRALKDLEQGKISVDEAAERLCKRR